MIDCIYTTSPKSNKLIDGVVGIVDIIGGRQRINGKLVKILVVTVEKVSIETTFDVEFKGRKTVNKEGYAHTQYRVNFSEKPTNFSPGW